MPQNPPPLPDFTRWPSFPFEGDMRVKKLADPVDVEPPRSGEDASDCVACNTPDDAYIWVSERWRVRGMDRPTGLPAVLILECRSHLDIGDLPNLLAAELGVMTVRLERAIRSLDGVARVHVNRWGDGSAHLHMWFLARPYGRLQLRGTFLSLWDDLLPVIPEDQWMENLAMVAAWLADFGGRSIAEPAHIHWQSPSTFGNESPSAPGASSASDSWRPTDLTDFESGRSSLDIADPGDLTNTDASTRGLSADTAGFATNAAPARTTDATDTTIAADTTIANDTTIATGTTVDTAPALADSGTTAESPETTDGVTTGEPGAAADTAATAEWPETADTAGREELAIENASAATDGDDRESSPAAADGDRASGSNERADVHASAEIQAANNDAAAHNGSVADIDSGPEGRAENSSSVASSATTESQTSESSPASAPTASGSSRGEASSTEKRTVPPTDADSSPVADEDVPATVADRAAVAAHQGGAAPRIEVLSIPTQHRLDLDDDGKNGDGEPSEPARSNKTAATSTPEPH